MEFYSTQTIEAAATTPFQFPTGWNSTMKRILLALVLSCFNSQRDGILLTASLFVVKAVLLGSFNSQRDGILRISGRAFLCDQRFQFPTGWNSTARILPFFYVERVKSIYFYALKWTKFKKAPITQCPKFQHFKILKATLSLSICVVSANVKI